MTAHVISRRKAVVVCRQGVWVESPLKLELPRPVHGVWQHWKVGVKFYL